MKYLHVQIKFCVQLLSLSALSENSFTQKMDYMKIKQIIIDNSVFLVKA